MLNLNHAQLLCLSVVLALCLLWASGCESTRAAPVDREKAHDAIVTTLDTWKTGQPIAALRDRQPGIVAQDLDWEMGKQLVDYRMVDSGAAFDANLVCDVELHLRDAQGNETRRQVSYIVGTDPVLTVFRKIF